MKPCMHLCSLPYVLHNLPISVVLIWSLEWYLVRNTEHKASCYVVFSTPLLPRPKYPTQHFILKNPQPTFLPQCEGPSFTPIQNNRQGYSSVYLDIYTFGYQTGRQEILHWMITSTPWIQSALNFFMNGIFIRYGCSQIFKLFHCLEEHLESVNYRLTDHTHKNVLYKMFHTLTFIHAKLWLISHRFHRKCNL